jgi:hypothetical protein
MGPRTAMLRTAAWLPTATLCTGLVAALDVNAQSLTLECSIGGQEQPELILVDPTTNSINTGKKIVPAQVTDQSITWNEDSTVRMVDRKSGAVLHRLPTRRLLFPHWPMSSVQEMIISIAQHFSNWRRLRFTASELICWVRESAQVSI